MTLPRQVVPGRDFMVTRRCSERRFFLRPDAETNSVFLYCLGLAARHANVHVLFTVAMSNHHHTSIHDPDGNVPLFLEHFHGLLARCQNALLGRFESFWSSEPTSVVRLVEPNDILDKMVYAFTNPASADLVDRIEDWPGATSFQATLSGGEFVATPPAHFVNAGIPGDCENYTEPLACVAGICRRLCASHLDCATGQCEEPQEGYRVCKL
jgi:REP element-mobilizing transposase RayT